jgi:hypothetical protein
VPGLDFVGMTLGHRSLEAVRGAAGDAVGPLQVAAGNMKHGVDVEISLAGPQLQKRDLVGVAEQPGGLMVERRPALVEPADAQQYPQAPTIRPQAAARWRGTAALDSGGLRWQILACH